MKYIPKNAFQSSSSNNNQVLSYFVANFYSSTWLNDAI